MEFNLSLRELKVMRNALILLEMDKSKYGSKEKEEEAYELSVRVDEAIRLEKKVKYDSLDLAEELLANLDFVNKKILANVKAKDIVSKYKYEELVKFALEFGVDLNHVKTN